MGIFDDHPPAYFTANCDQRLKDAWLDEGGKLAQPQLFDLCPSYVEYGTIKSESSRSVTTSHRVRQSYSPYPCGSLAASAQQAKKSSPSTSLPPASSALDGPFVHQRSPNLTVPGRLTQTELVVPEEKFGPRERFSASMLLDPATLKIKEEEDDVDSALTLGSKPGGIPDNSRDRELNGTIFNRHKYDERTIHSKRLRYAQDEDTQYHTARHPSRSTPQLLRGPSPFVYNSNASSSGQAPSRPPPSSFSDYRQEWIVNLLVFCSVEDEGLGRKDDEILGFPTKTKDSTLFIFSENWIERSMRSSVISTRGSKEQRLKVYLKDHLSQVPVAYQDHHAISLGRRSVLATPHRTSLPQPAWIAGDSRDQQIDSYPFPSGPVTIQEGQAVHRIQPRSHKQPLPISPMRTPSSKVPPEFEWNSNYDRWQREAERGRRLKRMEGAVGDIRESGAAGDSQWENQGRSVVGNKRLAGGLPSSRHMMNASNSTRSGRIALRETTNGRHETGSKSLSEPSRQIVRKLFGDTLGQHDTQTYKMDKRPRVEIHEDLSAKSALRKIKYMIQVQDSNGLRRIEVAIPDNMKKALGVHDMGRGMNQSLS